MDLDILDWPNASNRRGCDTRALPLEQDREISAPPAAPSATMFLLAILCLRRYSTFVNWKRILRLRTPLLRRSGWLLMLCLWVGSAVFSVSPKLHAWLHQDAHDIQHECFLTQLHQQTPDLGTPGLTSLWVPIQTPLRPKFHTSATPVSGIDLLPHSYRGPPTTCSPASQLA